MNTWLIIILVILLTSYFLELSVSLLNIRALGPNLPDEFRTIYNDQEYRKSQKYTRATTFFSLVENSLSTFLTVLFLLLGGFNYVDIWARSFGFGQISNRAVFYRWVDSAVISYPFAIFTVCNICHRRTIWI